MRGPKSPRGTESILPDAPRTSPTFWGCRGLQRPREEAGPLEGLLGFGGCETWPKAVRHLRVITPLQAASPPPLEWDWLCPEAGGMDRLPSKELGSCRAEPPAAEGGRPGIPLPRGQPLSRRAPTAPVASLGLSHCLNTVSHCCPPWQSQICPGAPGEPCSLSLVSLYGRGDGPWQRGEKRAPLFLSQAGTSGHKLTASVRERTPLPHVPEADG